MAPRVTKRKPVKAAAKVATVATSPRTFTPVQKAAHVADTLERLRNGERLRGIAAALGVTWSRLTEWCVTADATAYEDARRAQSEWHADQVMVQLDALVNKVATGDEIAATKLKIETHKWFATKLDPARYGERLQVDQRVTQLTVTLVRDERVVYEQTG